MVARRHARCSCSRPISAPTGPARRRRRRSGRPARTSEDPKVARPATFWRRLYLVDAESGATREVQPDGVNVFEFDWAGGKVAAVCTDEPSESAWYDAWIGLIDLETRGGRARSTSPSGSCSVRSSRRADASPGSRASRPTAESSPARCTSHGVGPLAPELDVTWIDFADEETLWYAGWRGAGSMYGRLAVDGSHDRSTSRATFSSARAFSRASAVAADGSSVAAMFESPLAPPEIARFEPRRGGRSALTSLNSELAAELPARANGARTRGTRSTASRSKACSRCRAGTRRRAAARRVRARRPDRRRGRGASRRC